MPAVQTGVFGAARTAAAGMMDQMYNGLLDDDDDDDVIHGTFTYNTLQYLFGLVNQTLDLESTVASGEHVEQLAPSLSLVRLDIELLHAHDEPPGVVETDAALLNDQALAEDKVVAVGQLLVEGDGSVGTGELAAQLELGERGEHEGCCVVVGVGKLQVV